MAQPVVSTRLSDDEYALIQRAASITHQKLAHFCREALVRHARAVLSVLGPIEASHD